MTPFDPWSGLAGGVLVGLASALLLAGLGRIAGISGILGGVLTRPAGDTAWRLAFIAGLLGGGAAYRLATGAFPLTLERGWIGMMAAGLLVGFGTRLGSGCTSGHGVCGLARLSPRSTVATAVFMLTAGVTVLVTRHGLGG